ncbi:hypothetical protein DCAR_0729350 [Daucus carota subsp. sativus]|uniref:Uncharacterized protein n=1 Tax=Daucus carota subsp. sativus TaxID=79200 RepID=A0A164U5H0_DAUCS|nr:hypothetical protein DCAR_0729350 [Daucus carota subsp. sativus]
MASKSRSSSFASGRACLCSPTTHPGSFRCSRHRTWRFSSSARSSSSLSCTAKNNRSVECASSVSNSSSSKMNQLLKAFLLQIIRPSRHNLQRRGIFRPKPTRFCNTSACTQTKGLSVS